MCPTFTRPGSTQDWGEGGYPARCAPPLNRAQDSPPPSISHATCPHLETQFPAGWGVAGLTCALHQLPQTATGWLSPPNPSMRNMICSHAQTQFVAGSCQLPAASRQLPAGSCHLTWWILLWVQFSDSILQGKPFPSKRTNRAT